MVRESGRWGGYEGRIKRVRERIKIGVDEFRIVYRRLYEIE